MLAIASACGGHNPGLLAGAGAGLLRQARVTRHPRVKRAWLLLLLAPGCAREHGRWPSLAPRPGELRRLDAGMNAAPATAPEPPPLEPALPVDPKAAGEWAKLRPRVPVATAALDRALARATRGRAGDEAWAAAQVEVSRAEQVKGDLDDLALRFGGTAEQPAAPADLMQARADLARRLESGKAALAR